MNINKAKKTEELIIDEKELFRQYLSKVYYEDLVDVVENDRYTLVLTTENNIYKIYYNTSSFKIEYHFLLNGDNLLDSKIVELEYSKEYKYEFYLKTAKGETYLFRILNENARVGDFYDGQVSSGDAIFYYKNLTDFADASGDVTVIFNNYNNRYDSFEAGIISDCESKCKVQNIIVEPDNSATTSNKTILSNLGDKKVKRLEYVNGRNPRLTLLTTNGEMYAVGTYGTQNIDSDYIFARKDVGENGELVKLELGELQGEITNFASSKYFDIISTSEATYMYGYVPSQFYYAWANPNQIFDFQLKELKRDGKPVISNSIYCQDRDKCYISTDDEKVLVFGRYEIQNGISRNPMIDEFQDFKYDKFPFTNINLDFEKTFSNSDEIYFTKDGNYVMQWTTNVFKLPRLEYYKTFDDYVSIRSDEYSDSMSITELEDFYKSIKNTLPISKFGEKQIFDSK